MLFLFFLVIAKLHFIGKILHNSPPKNFEIILKEVGLDGGKNILNFLGKVMWGYEIETL